MVGLIRLRAVSPVEVVEAHLRRIEKLNPHLNAIVTLAEDAMDRAREAEANPTNNPLHGLPVTIKDTIDTAGLRTTAGSRARANHIPVDDAASEERLTAGREIVLCQTSRTEIAV